MERLPDEYTVPVPRIHPGSGLPESVALVWRMLTYQVPVRSACENGGTGALSLWLLQAHKAMSIDSTKTPLREYCFISIASLLIVSSNTYEKERLPAMLLPSSKYSKFMAIHLTQGKKRPFRDI
jgi:hypothetical protein